jgi:hypothetical protein
MITDLKKTLDETSHIQFETCRPPSVELQAWLFSTNTTARCFYQMPRDHQVVEAGREITPASFIKEKKHHPWLQHFTYIKDI